MRSSVAVLAGALLASSLAHAQTVRDIANRNGCSTAGVEGLSAQLVQAQLCMRPDVFVRVTPHTGVNIVSPRVHPLMSRTARAAFWAAAERQRLDVASIFRTVAQQYVLYHSGACVAAARPGASNHQSGRAVDITNYGSSVVRSALIGAGCRWLGSFDPPHFDCPGADYRPDSIRAFQRLWNVNHPGDRIAEDGAYGPATDSRLARSPAGGFAQNGCVVDRDDDGVPDPRDNCPRDANGGQADGDDDGVGNVCDNCRTEPNAGQVDTDDDGVGNACDNCRQDRNAGQVDDDADGRGNACDNCRALANAGQRDSDADDVGDACDDDDDGDGVLDDDDNCAIVANAGQRDTDADGRGDACQDDDDGDAVPDATDNCRRDANADQADADGDGEGDVCDDTDGDGIPDAIDDGDLDDDGVADELDVCPMIADVDQADADADGLGDACDEDRDGDEVPNDLDVCPDVPDPMQLDQDADGVGDACDEDSTMPPERDGGSSPDPGADDAGLTVDGGPSPGLDGGCGCRASGHGDVPSGIVFAILAIALARRHRR